MSQPSANRSGRPVRRRSQLGQLTDAECIWRDRQPWLEEHGYVLRPRFRKDWKPSWVGTNKLPFSCEDGRMYHHPFIMDATRIADGVVVTLKSVNKASYAHEVEIATLFSEGPLKSDPRNHCVRILDVLQDPDDEETSIIVMPFLKKYFEPRFETVGEAVEFFHQTLEGLAFIHEQHVAHRDISPLNIMMDPLPLYPQLYHPTNHKRTRDYSRGVRPYTRTERPTKYYFIDFGLSQKYSPENVNPLEMPISGGDRTVPEFESGGYKQPCNPFLTDVYYLGNRFREEFLQKYKGLEFMDDLVAAMVATDPQKRPSAQEAASRFAALQSTLPWWKVRQRLVSRKENAIGRGLRGLAHLLRTTAYVILRLSAIPSPPVP